MSETESSCEEMVGNEGNSPEKSDEEMMETESSNPPRDLTDEQLSFTFIFFETAPSWFLCKVLQNEELHGRGGFNFGLQQFVKVLT